jgi:hypothetical protein
VLVFRLLLPALTLCVKTADLRTSVSCIILAREEPHCWLLSSDLSFLLCGQKQTVASVGIGYGSGAGNKWILTYIDRRECIFLHNSPYSAHKLRKEDIVFLSYAWRFEMYSVQRSIRRRQDALPLYLSPKHGGTTRMAAEQYRRAAPRRL